MCFGFYGYYNSQISEKKPPYIHTYNKCGVSSKHSIIYFSSLQIQREKWRSVLILIIDMESTRFWFITWKTTPPFHINQLLCSSNNNKCGLTGPKSVHWSYFSGMSSGGWLDSNGNIAKQAGAELGQAQPELGFWENDLSQRVYIWDWAWMARGLR